MLHVFMSKEVQKTTDTPLPSTSNIVATPENIQVKVLA